MQSIEGARGIAALMVVFMHAANLMRVDHFSGHVGLGDIFGFGYVGVDFFFVLSGFIITYVHFADIGKPQKIPIYLWRRLTRIYPIFWFCLVLAVLVLCVGRWLLGKDAGLAFSYLDLAGTVFLLPVAEPQYLGVAWSLQFEVMFYVLFCALLVSRRFGTGFLVVWALGIVYKLVWPGALSWSANLWSGHSLQFIMGIAVGAAVRTWHFKCIGWAATGLALAAFVGAVVFERAVTTLHSGAGRVALGLASAAILLCLVELEKKRAIATPRLIYQLGTVSYSIYLSHIIFINVIYMLLLKAGVYHLLPEVLVFTLAVAGAVSCALIIGFAVELPLVGRLKSLTLAKSSG